jgi:hypothetical protein
MVFAGSALERLVVLLVAIDVDEDATTNLEDISKCKKMRSRLVHCVSHFESRRPPR